MLKDDYLSDVQWPSFIAMPKPGQSIDDDDCLWTSLFNATVQQMTIFLLHEPQFVDETTRKKLTRMVNYARDKAKPDDNFLESIGFSPDNIEKARREKGPTILRGARATAAPEEDAE